MLKLLSAGLLAVSMLAAPAFAANSDKTSPAPVIKAEQVKPEKTMTPSVAKANAKMGRHHRYTRHHRHHRFHKHMSAIKAHQPSKVTSRHMAPAVKRG